MVDSMTNLKIKLSDLNKLSQDHTDSPRITRKPSDRKLQLIAIDEHGEVTIDYSCGIRIEELLFDERRSVQFIKDFETTKPEAIKFLSQPQQLKEIVDCVLEDVERYLTPPKPQAAPAPVQRPSLRYTRSRDRMVPLRKESSFDNLLSSSPTRVSITSRESLQSLTLANTSTRPLSLSSDSIPVDKKKKKRHNSHDELTSEERKRKRKEFNPDGSPKEKEKKRDKRRSSGEKEKRKKDKDKLSRSALEPTISEEPIAFNNNSASQESSEDSGGESPVKNNTNDTLGPIPEGSQDTEKMSSSNESIKPNQPVPIVEPSATPTNNNGKEGIPRLMHSLSSPALLEDTSNRQQTPRLPDEIEEMPGVHKDKDANGEEENQPQKKTPVVDVSLFKDEKYRRQSLINFGSWVLTTPTLVIEALIDNEECLEILLGGLNSVAENMFDTTPTKGREWFKVMHFLFCKYEKGPKLVEYLENPEHLSKSKTIAFGLVNKIANGNVFRIFWEMMVGETLVNWSTKLEENPFKLSETILEKIQAICNTEYTYKADLELMNITELVTQVIKRGPQSPMAVKFQSAQFIKSLIELSFADLPSPVVTHIISIITVILELSVNNDSKYNSRRFPPAILTFLESPTKPIMKLKHLLALDSALRHKPSTRQRADPAQTAEQEQAILNQYWGHSLIDNAFVSIKSLSIKALELLNALLLSNFEAIHKQMDADEIYDLAFKAFFDQPLNSVLHLNVVNMISNLFYCENYDITIGFVKRSGLLDRICNELQPEENDKNRYIKASYAHYLIHLADKLNRVAAMITPLNDVLEAHPQWKEVFTTRIEPYLEEMSKKICK